MTRYTVLNLHLARMVFIGTEDETKDYLKPRYPGVQKIRLNVEFANHWVRPARAGDKVTPPGRRV